jgi:putative colanic acid biosynthesis UDP-glucose lipid carrier transferase
LILLVTAPLLPLIALAIKLESPGPVFFNQRRRGRYQTIINVLKFRTMRVMEDGNDVRQAVAGDSRVTTVGRFLRRSSLDELPQLFNVIRGEMSLVGPRPHARGDGDLLARERPRPHALVHDEEFSQLLKMYPDRHQMRPGITGLAQVCGHRGSTAVPGSIDARVAADLAYVQSWSLWLDLKILCKTFFAVVSGKNAD